MKDFIKAVDNAIASTNKANKKNTWKVLGWAGAMGYCMYKVTEAYTEYGAIKERLKVLNSFKDFNTEE